MKNLINLKKLLKFNCLKKVRYSYYSSYQNSRNYMLYEVLFNDKVIGYVKSIGGSYYSAPSHWESWNTRNIKDVTRKYVRGSKKLLGEYQNRIDAAAAILAKQNNLKEISLKKNTFYKNVVIVGLENPQIIDDKVNPLDSDSDRPKITADLSLIENGRLRKTNVIINPKIKNKVFTSAQQQEIKVDNLEEYIGLVFSSQQV